MQVFGLWPLSLRLLLKSSQFRNQHFVKRRWDLRQFDFFHNALTLNYVAGCWKRDKAISTIIATNSTEKSANGINRLDYFSQASVGGEGQESISKWKSSDHIVKSLSIALTRKLSAFQSQRNESRLYLDSFKICHHRLWLNLNKLGRLCVCV